MENLAPPLSVLLEVRWEMENGASFRESLRVSLRRLPADPFLMRLRQWSVRKSHGQPVQDLVSDLKSPYRRALLELFARGWDGEPILEPVEALESELRSACEAELDDFVATLPFRAMIPLLLLQLPAYMLLLLGPVFSELLKNLGTT